MTIADSAGWALAITAACAVLARLVGALTTDGAVAGAVVGACVSLGFGLPGLAVLGTFFVVGTLATRIGWETKKARGTAEAGEGRRDWKRVVGKGGVAASVSIGWAFPILPLNAPSAWASFCGAIAAALADTLATEIGTLSSSAPRTLPSFRKTTTGTPGAVTSLGVAAAVVGAGMVAAMTAWLDPWRPIEEPANPMLTMSPAHPPLWRFVLFDLYLYVAAAGVAASLAESLAVGVGLRAPGFVRNLFTTAAGALLAYWLCPLSWFFLFPLVHD